MFDYPFSYPKTTQYKELGLTPDATDDEIKTAISDRRTKLNAKKTRVDKALNKVYEAVPGLREAYEQKQEQTTLSKLLPQALAQEPEFHQLQQQRDELDQKIKDLNNIDLENSEKRHKYDTRHPPLKLLQFSDASNLNFSERKNTLFLLRREISGFLSNQGETVFHPSDLTRENFTGDFSFNSKLDEESHG